MMARTAALLAGAGAFICLLGSFVPGEAQFDDDVLLVAAAASALLGAVPPDRLRQHPGCRRSTRSSASPRRSPRPPPTGGARSRRTGRSPTSGSPSSPSTSSPAAPRSSTSRSSRPPTRSPSSSRTRRRTRSTAGSPRSPRCSSPGLFVSMVRDHIAALIRRLSDAAHSDHLTGLLNRRGFQNVFDTELERARRADQALSLIVGDLDRFKRVNDAHGHAAGDEVLTRVAAAIAGAKRGFDSAARVGGEEFAVLAPDCDEHGAFMLAERIRAAVHEALVARDPGTSLTISFGISTFPLHGQSADAPASHRRPGALRGQAPRPQPLGDLERRGARHPRPRAAARGRPTSARGARRAAQPRRGARRARLGERLPLPQGRPLRRADRARAGAVPRGRRARAARRDPSRRGPRRAVPSDLLSKNEPLTDDEWVLVRAHPVAGARMVETTEYDDIRSWILFHHERPDGTGYPEGRGESDVPLESSIIGVADAYEAMTSDRPYRRALASGGRRRRAPPRGRAASSAPTWSTRSSGPSNPYGLPL